MHAQLTPTPRPLRHALALATAMALVALSGPSAAAPGDLDLTFGTNGVLFIDATQRNDQANDLWPLADGSLLVAGSMDNGVPSSGDLAVLRLTAAGDVDLDFGSNGAAFVDTGTDGDEANALLVQPDGDIVAAGALESGAYIDFGIARFNADGSPDTSFGEPDGMGARLGYARTNLGPDDATNDQANAVARQSDGKLVLAGQASAQDGGFRYTRFGLVRFSTDGTVDTSFGGANTGKVIAPATAFQVGEFATDIALRADGTLPPDNKLTVVGYVFARSQALVRRYNADGTPDTSFDGDGTLVIEDALTNSVPSGMSQIEAAVLQPDGKLVVVGTARDRGFTFMRFNSDGSRDAGFGNNGRVNVKFSLSTDYDHAYAVALHPNGKIVASGSVTGRYDGSIGNDFGVVRLLPDGTPDSGFGDGQGRSTYPLVTAKDEARAMAVGARGELTAAGFALRPGGSAGTQNDMAFLRLQGDAGIFSDGFED